MQSPRLAGRYAKSLIDLSQEKGQLETVYKDMQYLQQVVRQSRDFVVLMKSPVIKADKKNAILEAVSKDKVSELTAKTVARPAGMLGGGLCAFLGSLLLLYVSRRYGYEYNFFSLVIFLFAGYVLGFILEFGYRGLKRRRHEY